MEIKINHNGVSRYINGTTFPLGDIDINFVDFPNAGHPSAEYRFCARLIPVIGKPHVFAGVTVYANNPSVTIPAGQVSAGVFKSYLAVFVCGKELKRYVIEDLIITDVDCAKVADPEKTVTERRLETLEHDIKKISESQKEMSEYIAALQNTVAATKKELLSLAKFAFDDYKSNVYLDGNDSAEAFLKKYNITTITEKELKGEE